MTVRWNANQPQVLKRAYAMVSLTEVVVVLAIVFAIRLGTRTRPLPLPVPDIPIIVVRYPDVLQPPPSIDPDVPKVVPAGPVAIEAPSGIPVPVPDRDATQQTMPTQGQLLAGPGPLPKPDGVVIKVVPDTAPAQPKSDTEPAAIPKPGEYVKTTVRPEVVTIPELQYPEHCRVLGIEGTTWVQMLLALDGSVMETRVAKTSDNADLDSAAVQSARRSRFSPALGAQRNPVHVWVSMPFTFRLQH